MPEQTDTPEELIESPQDEPVSGGTSLLTKLVILFFLAAVVLGECMVVYFFLPSRAETALMAGVELASPTTDSEGSSPESDEPEGEDDVSQVEVDLGEFSVTAYQPISNTSLRIDFHLYGTVSTEDEADFLAKLESNVHRFRDQVIITVRSSDITDLTDAGLGLIKRKILEKTNTMLGKRYLRAVIFSDFSFIEQ